MERPVNNNVANGEEQVAKSFKKLHVLVESGEFAEYLKRIAEIKKRVDKLFSAEKSRLAEIQAERARAEEERRAVEAAEKEEARRQAQQETVPAEEPPVAEVKPEAQQDDRPAPAVSEEEPAPAPIAEEKQVESSKPAAPQPTQKPAPVPSGVTISEPPQSATRTAIPSYIRGVVKHTPRPQTERPARPERGRPQGGAPRPSGMGGASRPQSGAQRPVALPKFEVPATPKKRVPADKKATAKSEDKRQMNKRTLIRKGYIQENMDEERMGTRKLKNKKVAKVVPFAPIKIENAVITTENLTVKILSEKIGKTAQEIIKKLMELGIMTNINSVVDFPTMQLVADALGVNIELKLEKTKEEELSELHSEPDPEDSLVKRPPIVTVMGHVDHGKTSLLDAIRKTSVVSGEAGGITQHIGAYSVELNGEKITFLDTPGHEAFTEMRRRGADVTDIAVLIVAADDGVMPQTIEAIKHANAAGVPIIVAANKIDKPGANIERVKQQLAEVNVLCEDWGGDVPLIPVSAKQGTGIDKLLENILFRAEYAELRANPNRRARGYVIEARLDKGRGPVASVIVQNGTLHIGDFIVSGTAYGKVRSLTDDKGKVIKSAGPSMPVAVIGLDKVPMAGEQIVAVTDEKMARQVIAERQTKLQNEKLEDVRMPDISLFGENADGGAEKVKEYKVLVKADVQGSSEAIKDAVLKLSTDEVKVSVVSAGVGAISQSDVMMAEVSGAVIIGFNVRPDSEARANAEKLGIKIKLYSIIYDALDDIRAETEALIAPKFVERVTGRAIVRMAFKVSGVGIVAGSYVQSGKIVRNGKARLYRGGKLIFDGNIVGLKRFKDDAKEVTVGLECGIALADYTDFIEDDELECYVVEKESK